MSFFLALTALSLVFPLASSSAFNNVVFSPSLAYASAGTAGIAVLSTAGVEQSTVAAPPSFEGIHDLSVADGLLFALDASGGNLAVYSLASAASPTLLPQGETVPVGPFSGVSAGGGKVAVSGGTRTMSLFSYTSAGALQLLADDIDLGTGQPDVLLDAQGEYAYVSTDFAGQVDGQAFGITTLDLGSDLADPASTSVGIDGAGFTGGVGLLANFPIESAISGSRLLVAHGGGLSVFSLKDRANPVLEKSIDVGFEAVSVDADGDRAVVVGVNGDEAAAARVNLKSNAVEKIELPNVDGAGEATGVAVRGDTVIVAAGELMVCDGDCGKKAVSGSGSEKGGGKGVCVDEEHLLAKGVPRSAFLHAESSLEEVFCVGRGLPCGTANHVVRFAHEYLTYQEACDRVGEECEMGMKKVNGVSMRYARHLCDAGEAYCVIPHVMLTGLEIERTAIQLLHRTLTR